MRIARPWVVACGVALVALAVVVPSGWFVPLPPHTPTPPPPIAGFTLVQVSLWLEGLALIWFGLRREPLVVTDISSRMPVPGPDGEDRSAGRSFVWPLTAVALLGFALRVISLNSDLWLDEITPIRAYSDASVWQVVISYNSTNNHLLNTVLVKASTLVFGEQEWAIRLPAMLWGTATIPVLYWVARQAMSKQASLSAALLLALSYHHIFFSQNARGYTAYLCLSLVSSVLLIKGLNQDRPRIWAGFVAATVLNFASLLISGFVFAAHALVGGLAVLAIARNDLAWRPMLGRLIGVLAITTFFGFQLYAAVLPQMYVLMNAVYTESTSGYTPFSMELVAEVVRGVAAGFGTGMLLGAIPFLALAAAGYVILLKRHWMLALALTLPCVLQLLLLLGRGFTFSPRFFLLVLPLAILVAVQAISSASAGVARLFGKPAAAKALATATVALLCVASAAALPHYYTVPKQPYRAALTYVEAVRPPDGLVIVVHYAEAGVRYYTHRLGLAEQSAYRYVRTPEALDEVLAANRDRPVWVLTTFSRALRLAAPALQDRINRGWHIERTFEATVGDGAITVWRPRVSPVP